MSKQSVYDELGVPRLINGVGTKTRVSGTLIRPEAADAMREAADSFAKISDLQSRASALISEHTGAEAGYVVTGAAAGLTMSAAACIAQHDLGDMARLPNTDGIADEILIPHSHRNSYDHALRASGATLISVGNSDLSLGPGSNDLEPWEIEDAITDDTVAIAYVARNQISLPEVTSIAHDHELPVIVDAAGQLPPKENLSKFIDQGADLVTFSGGKGIRGPQSTGIIAGRKDLIGSIALQHLDMDAVFETWEPPADLIDKDDLPGVPRHGIGRGFKVGKEELVGLLRAFKLFVEEDTSQQYQQWHERATDMQHALEDIEGLTATCIDDDDPAEVTSVAVTMDEDECGISAVNLIKELRRETPRVFVGDRRASEGIFTVNPMSLSEEDVDYLIDRIVANLR